MEDTKFSPRKPKHIKPPIFVRILKVLKENTKAPIFAKDLYDQVVLDQSTGEPTIPYNSMRTALIRLVKEGHVHCTGSGRDRTFKIGNEDPPLRGIIKFDTGNSTPKSEYTVKELIEEFKALTETVFDKLRLFDEMERSMNFWVNEAKNMGVRPGVLNKNKG